MIQFISFESTSKEEARGSKSHNSPISKGEFRKALEDIRDSTASSKTGPKHSTKVAKEGEDRNLEEEDKNKISQEGIISHKGVLLENSWPISLYLSNDLPETDVDPGGDSIDFYDNQDPQAIIHNSAIDGEQIALSHSKFLALDQVFGDQDRESISEYMQQLSINGDPKPIEASHHRILLNEETMDSVENILDKVEYEVDLADLGEASKMEVEFQAAMLAEEKQLHKADTRTLEQNLPQEQTPLEEDPMDDTLEDLGVISAHSYAKVQGEAKDGERIGLYGSEQAFIEGKDLESQEELQDSQDFQSNDEVDLKSLESLMHSSRESHLDFGRVLDKQDPIESIQLIESLADRAITAMNGDESQLEIEIRPRHLGKLVLKVALEDGNLTGKIFTSNNRIKEFLNTNLEDLKNTLKDQGFTFTSLDVDVGDQYNPNSFGQLAQTQTKPRRNNPLGEKPQADAIDSILNHSKNTVVESGKIDYLA